MKTMIKALTSTGLVLSSLWGSGGEQSPLLSSGPDINPALRLAPYGGAAGNAVYQHYADVMPGFLCNNIRANHSLDALLREAANVRAMIAEKTGSNGAASYKQYMRDVNPGVSGSVTPMTLYPFMKDTTVHSLQSLPLSDEFQPLDGEIEARHQLKTLREWLPFIASGDSNYVRFNDRLGRLIHGKEGKGEAGLELIDMQTGAQDRTYIDALKSAHALATRGTPLTAEEVAELDRVKVGYVEFRHHGTSFLARSFMFP